jgi:hypothetical protein
MRLFAFMPSYYYYYYCYLTADVADMLYVDIYLANWREDEAFRTTSKRYVIIIFIMHASSK